MRSTTASVTAAATTLTIALLLAGCSTGGDSGSESLSESSSTSEQSSVSDAAAESGDLAAPSESGGETTGEGTGEGTGPSTEQDSENAEFTGILEAALVAVPGVVVGLEEGTHRSIPVWEVLVRAADGSGVEVKVDRATGEVVAQESESLDHVEATPPEVTIEQAIAVALTQVPGSLVEIELDDEDGVVVWEAKIRGTSGVQKVELDATTAGIIRVK